MNFYPLNDTDSCLPWTEKLWFHVDARLQLYHTRDLGGRPHVLIHDDSIDFPLTHTVFSILALLSTSAGSLHDTPIPHSIYSGSPAGLIYGYLLVWVGTASIFATLGELASMYDQH